MYRKNHAKTAEPIERPFGTVGGVNPVNRVLDGRAYWCHIANTVERLCAAAISETATRGATRPVPNEYQ